MVYNDTASVCIEKNFVYYAHLSYDAYTYKDHNVAVLYPDFFCMWSYVSYNETNVEDRRSQYLAAKHSFSKMSTLFELLYVGNDDPRLSEDGYWIGSWKMETEKLTDKTLIQRILPNAIAAAADEMLEIMKDMYYIILSACRIFMKSDDCALYSTFPSSRERP